MTPEQRKLAYELVTNPPSGSNLATAKDYGIDLTLLVENLDLSVDERLAKLYAVASFLDQMRGTAGNER
jgi:hypothetical protein